MGNCKPAQGRHTYVTCDLADEAAAAALRAVDNDSRTKLCSAAEFKCHSDTESKVFYGGAQCD